MKYFHFHESASLDEDSSVRFRKTLKNVGKSSSVPVQSNVEKAERTWSHDTDFIWSNGNGKKIELGGTHLQNLSELECDALRKVARHRLEEIDMGVPIVEPKDDSAIMKRKMSARKKYGVSLHLKEKNKDKNVDHVFGIPLIDVVENDQLLRLQKSFSPLSDTARGEHGPDIVVPDHLSLSSSSSSSCSGSTTSIHNQENTDPQNTEQQTHKNSSEDDASRVGFPSTPDGEYNPTKDSFHSKAGLGVHNRSVSSSASQSLRRRGAIATESIEKINPDQSELLEALSRFVRSGSQQNQKKVNDRSMLPPTMAQVPYVVQKCCDYIKEHGLDVTGIFRIAGSKKRVKQLREEFDRGIDVTIEEGYNPHDVGALLKEFFRELPEALLSRELYPAFIQTAKLPKHQKVEALRYLLWLLPFSNRDTLQTLLQFLAVVAAHSETSIDREGNKVPGNKMTVGNLAVIFGPNILHRYKKSQGANESHYQGPSLEKPEDSTAVVKVVEDLINNQLQLFQIPKNDHNAVLTHLKETNPTAVDYLLRRKAAEQLRSNSRLPSPMSISPTTPNPPGNKMNSHEGLGTKPESHKAPDEAVHLREKANDRFGRMAAMRISYQQAMGHLTLPISDFKEDFSQPKFDRPIPEHACYHHSPDTDQLHVNGCDNLNVIKQINKTDVITSGHSQRSGKLKSSSSSNGLNKKLHRQTKPVIESMDSDSNENMTCRKQNNDVKLTSTTDGRQVVQTTNHKLNKDKNTKSRDFNSFPSSKEDLNNNSFLKNKQPSIQLNSNQNNNHTVHPCEPTYCNTHQSIHKVSSVKTNNDILYFVSASKPLPYRQKSFTKNCSTDRTNKKTTNLIPTSLVQSVSPSANCIQSLFIKQTSNSPKETDKKTFRSLLVTAPNTCHKSNSKPSTKKDGGFVESQNLTTKQLRKLESDRFEYDLPTQTKDSLSESKFPAKCCIAKQNPKTLTDVDEIGTTDPRSGSLPSLSDSGFLSSTTGSDSFVWNPEANEPENLFETFV